MIAFVVALSLLVAATETETVLVAKLDFELGTVVLDIRLSSKLRTAVLDRELDTVLNIKLCSELGT